MEYRELGATGVMIPEVGLGTWKYRGGPEPLRRGIELGANLIDTAEMCSVTFCWVARRRVYAG